MYYCSFTLKKQANKQTQKVTKKSDMNTDTSAATGQKCSFRVKTVEVCCDKNARMLKLTNIEHYNRGATTSHFHFICNLSTQ